MAEGLAMLCLFFSFFSFQFYCNTQGVLILHIQQVYVSSVYLDF